MRTPLPRALLMTLVSLAVLAAACGSDDPESADATTSTLAAETTTTAVDVPAGPAGPIVFKRLAPGKDEGEEDIYTVNPDGTGVRLLYEGPAEGPEWSPDGTEVSIFCCGDGMVAHFVDVATGALRELAAPDPDLETHCGGTWSPDGERLACEVFGVGDPDRNGIYSISAADGGDLARITSNPGGDDIPGDYSPDGSQLVFARFEEDDAPPIGLFVINVDGSGLRQITPPDMHVDGFPGQWSPDGKKILMVGLSDADRKLIYVVDVAGGDPVPLPITPECGGARSDPDSFGCYSPTWSPDGTKILFVRSKTLSESDGTFSESIYMVNADGSGLVQVTDGQDDQPKWGTPASG